MDARAVAQEPSAGRSLRTQKAPVRRSGGPLPRLGRVRDRVPPRLQLPLAIFVAAELGFLFYWFAFYPALLSYDSVAYTWQVTTDHWSTNHSIVYNALVWLSLRVSGGVALLTLAQTVAFAAALAFAATGIHQLGVRARWAALPAVVLPYTPMLGPFPVYVWKDVPFVACEIVLLGCTARLLAARQADRASWFRERRTSRILGGIFLSLLGMALFRSNGFLFAVLAALLIALAVPRVRLRSLAAGVAAAVLAIGLNTAVFPALGAATPASDLVLGPAYADIAVAYHTRPGVFTGAELALMRQVAPLKSWDKGGQNCYSSDVLNAQKTWSRTAADRVHEQLFTLWRQVLTRTPDFVFQARICRGAIAWSIWPANPRLGPTAFPNLSLPADFFGWAKYLRPGVKDVLRPDAPSSQLHDAGKFLVAASHTRQLEWVLWRGATWAYLGYLAVFLASRRRRNWALLALAAGTASNQLNVLVNNPNQLVRYMIGCSYLGALLLPLALRSAENADRVVVGDPRPRPATDRKRQVGAATGTRRSPHSMTTR